MENTNKNAVERLHELTELSRGNEQLSPPTLTRWAVLYQGQRIADIEIIPPAADGYHEAAIVWLINADGSWSHTEEMTAEQAEIFRDRLKEEAKEEAYFVRDLVLCIGKALVKAAHP